MCNTVSMFEFMALPNKSVINKLRAKFLAKADYDLVFDLVRLREKSGLSQTDVAERLGISQQAVSKFERMESDPRLSTIRSYAHAIEALVSHDVTKDVGLLAFNFSESYTLHYSSTESIDSKVFRISPTGKFSLAA